MEWESFAAVGQWGNLAIVLLVLFAAVISRTWDRNEFDTASIRPLGVDEGGGRSDSTNAISAGHGGIRNVESEWESSEDEDIETKKAD